MVIVQMISPDESACGSIIQLEKNKINVSDTEQTIKKAIA
jgi:hypothetical protein